MKEKDADRDARGKVARPAAGRGAARTAAGAVAGAVRRTLAAVGKGAGVARRWALPVGIGMAAGAVIVVLAIALYIGFGMPAPVGPGFLARLGTGEEEAVGQGAIPGRAATGTTATAGQPGGGPATGSSASGGTESSSGSGSGAASTPDRGSEPGQGKSDGTGSGSPSTSLSPDEQVGAISWSWPVQGPIQARFGWHQHPVYQDWRLHAGLDIQVAPGTSVKAAAAGEVHSVYNDPVNSLTIVLDHGNGVQSFYGGLAQVSVKVGQTVAKAEVVGRAGGATSPDGRPYLYFAIKAGDEPVDPLPLLPLVSTLVR